MTKQDENDAFSQKIESKAEETEKIQATGFDSSENWKWDKTNRFEQEKNLQFFVKFQYFMPFLRKKFCN